MREDCLLTACVNTSYIIRYRKTINSHKPHTCTHTMVHAHTHTWTHTHAHTRTHTHTHTHTNTQAHTRTHTPSFLSTHSPKPSLSIITTRCTSTIIPILNNTT